MYQILLVDDEPIVKIALRSIVQWEQYGYQICGTASNGEEALAMVEKHKPQIVITDLKMPVMDGIELIKNLKEKGFRGEILVLSNYEDFELVRNALVHGAADYLLKVSIDGEALLDRISKAINKLQERKLISMAAAAEENPELLIVKRSNIIKEFLTQDKPVEQFISAQPETIFLQEDVHYSLCYVSFDRSASNNSGEYSKSLIRSIVLEALQEQSNSLWFSLDQYSLCILLGVEDITEDTQLKQFAGKLATRFQVYHSLKPVICYDFDVKGYDLLHKSYHMLLEVLKLQFYGELSIEDGKEICPQHYMSFIQYKDLAEDIQRNGSSMLTRSMIAIEEIIMASKEQHIYPEITCRFFIKVLEYLEFLSKDMSLLTHEYLADMKEFLRFSSSSKELLSYLEQSLQAIYLLQEIGETDTARYKNEINKAIKYIEKNYQQKLTLTSIAEHVNFSTNYLCKSFKEEVGVNVIGYINNFRMKKAGEMLKQKDSMVKEISLNVGIEDQLYFSRLFKKYYGMSPSEYKNLYMQ
ncbi:MAG: hypothetical protein K0S04_2537 [Herbinix sp.]|jgi:two-component system response regulator YesN|nr:hypothetical protein [Herbinix sp.]